MSASALDTSFGKYIINSNDDFERIRLYCSSIHAAKTYLTEYIKECVYFDLSMSPAQRFVKDQSFAYAKTTLRDLCNDTLITACLREGIENLYFLGHFWRGDDAIVRVSVIIIICGDIIFIMIIIINIIYCISICRHLATIFSV